jgi:hypothetical protein
MRSRWLPLALPILALAASACPSTHAKEPEPASSAAPASAKPSSVAPVAPVASAVAAPTSASASEAWDPKNTRAFVACLAQFEGEEAGDTSFSTDDRNDTTFVALLKKRGVPADRITFLMDGDATERNARAKLTAALKASQPGETLLFYFGSHGGHDPDKGTWWFSTFDGTIPMEWAIDAIEQDFKGSRAMLFSDSCYSGGLVELAKTRGKRVSYAVLSSTSPQQVAWSGWRFVDVLLRGFGGNPAADLDGDGHVDLDELDRYAGERMAFLAEGKPQWTTTGSFPKTLRLTDDARPKGDAKVGSMIEVHWGKKWYQAEILKVESDGKVRVHYEGYGSEDDETVTADRVRPFAFDAFEPQTKVEAKSSWTGKWGAATVLARSGSLHQVRFAGTTAAYDEWVGPSRARLAKK